MLTWGSSIFARVQSKNCNLEKSGSSFGSRPEKHQPGAEPQEHQQTAIKVVDVTCAVPKHQGGREKNWKIHPHGPENGTCCLKKKRIRVLDSTNCHWKGHPVFVVVYFSWYQKWYCEHPCLTLLIQSKKIKFQRKEVCTRDVHLILLHQTITRFLQSPSKNCNLFKTTGGNGFLNNFKKTGDGNLINLIRGRKMKPRWATFTGFWI